MSRILSTQSFRAAGVRDSLPVRLGENDVQDGIRKDQRSHSWIRFFVNSSRFGSALVVVVRSRMPLSIVRFEENLTFRRR